MGCNKNALSSKLEQDSGSEPAGLLPIFIILDKRRFA